MENGILNINTSYLGKQHLFISIHVAVPYGYGRGQTNVL